MKTKLKLSTIKASLRSLIFRPSYLHEYPALGTRSVKFIGKMRQFSLSLLVSILIIFSAINKAEARIQPQPISPENGAVLDNGCENRSDDIVWTFQWTQPSLGATQYHLVVTGSDATTPVIDRSDLTSTTYTDTSSGSYIAEQNRRGWRWAVRALINGTWSDWGPVSTFDVEPLNTDCR